MSDEQFFMYMADMKNGNKNALKTVYQEYLPYIYTIIFNIVQDKHDAEDLTSEFFIKLWTIADHYAMACGHKGYIATIARNMTIDFLRKNKREILIETFEKDSLEDTEQTSSKVQNESISADNVEDEVLGEIYIEQALALLSPQEKEVVHLKVIGEMTFQAISDLLKIPLGTITWRYQSAIKKLRRCGYEQGL